MDIAKVIDLTAEILTQLNWIENNISQEDYESDYESKIEDAYDKLKDVNDLIGG